MCPPVRVPAEFHVAVSRCRPVGSATGVGTLTDQRFAHVAVGGGVGV